MAGLGAQIGTDLQIAAGDLTTNSPVQQHPLGALATTGDGRYFRYVQAGATALVVGDLQQAAAETTAWQDLDPALTLVGATSITLTSTVTLTANQLAEGYVVDTNGSGAGYSYKIKSHPAVTGAVVTLQLYDAVQVQIAATDDVDLIMSPYKGVIINPSTPSGMPVGVAVFPITATYFGWVQCRGPVGVLVDAGNIVVGVLVVASDDTAGAVGPYETDAITTTVGVALTGGSSTEYALVNLLIS